MNIDTITIGSNQEEEIRDLTTAYPYVVHHLDMKRVSVPWHWHEEVEFCHVLKGSVIVMTINNQYIVHENEVFFINSKVLCCMKPAPANDVVIMDSHLFHPVFLSGHYKSVFESKFISPVIQNKNVDVLVFRKDDSGDMNLIRKIQSITKYSGQLGEAFYIRNAFSEIWILLIQKMQQLPNQSMTANSRLQDRMQTMMSFIHQNYSDKVTLEDIANSALVSTRECIRCFRNSIDKSPIEYLMEYRVEIAKKLLVETSYTITEIAMYVGFSSNAYFGKIFREKIGIAPMMYRKKKVPNH